MEQEYQSHKLVWRGRDIDVAYNPRSFADTAHLKISAKNARPLPIAETGFRSHFADPADVQELGGPAAYVEAWLDAMAETKTWTRTEQGGYQMSLL